MGALETYKIKVNKKTLLFFAGVFWSLAGWRVLAFGYEDLFWNAERPWAFLLISLAVFLLFFALIFNQMVKRHYERIISSNLAKHCIFSFLDLQGYAVMVVMMVGGITLRNAHIINPVYIGSLYLGIGSALLSAGIKVLNTVVNI